MKRQILETLKTCNTVTSNMPTQWAVGLTRPMEAWCLSCLTWGSPFIRISAVWLSVGVYLRSMTPEASFSWTKWWWTSICFECAWNVGLCVMVMADWLLMRRVVGVMMSWPISTSSCRSHMASLAPWADAMYSPSMLESATVGCFFEAQLIVAPFQVNMQTSQLGMYI